MATTEYVARRLLRIGDERISPGAPVPAGIDRGRLLRMLANNSIVEAGSIYAPEPSAPVEAPESPQEASEPEEALTDSDEAPAPQSATESDDEASEWPLHDGGPFFLLSDGTRVKGKADAQEQQAFLDELAAEGL